MVDNKEWWELLSQVKEYWWVIAIGVLLTVLVLYIIKKIWELFK
ncbi:MAG: hypothetical protein MRERV_12c013 [Mycoplasmataceae bacterium RV_VA103A]|nr:MAG: hypothetical protein MRERV_12c013 [Mycoplasmataceae bacterium RV_VA103A]